MKKIALYAGSFDPFTNGHLDIVKRGLKLFDEVRVVVAKSPNKNALFDTSTRQKVISDVFAGNPAVKVDSWDGLIVDYAKREKIGFILRGLRPTGDFENEFQMASMNKHLFENIETFFLTTGEDYFYVSSSLVKEVHRYGGDIKELVPKQVLDLLINKNKA